MKIAILGGTGKEGPGLAARWVRAGHSVIIGSRDAERARGKAAELTAALGGGELTGEINRDAAAKGDIVVLALPATGLATTLPDMRDACRGKIVVSTVVPLTFGGGRLFAPPAAGSSAEEAQALLPEARVVAAFHHIAAHELSDIEHPIDCDLLHCGGDAEAKDAVVQLAASMGLRPVDVGALTDRASAVVWVRDRGVGIPERDRDRIFERFYRVDRARSRELGGTGLGLAIVKHVLNRHQARLEITSEPGRGSTFSAVFPEQRLLARTASAALARSA